jgi:DNA-directed RNA polymerase specialized sigma24 family protein
VTRRSLLPPPGARDEPKRRESWDYLCRTYTPAMVEYVRDTLRTALGRPVEREQAADVVQDYLLQAFEKGWLDRTGEEIRCFRAWLQAQLRRFTISHLRHEHAQKRSPGRTETSDALERVASGGPDPAEAVFDAAWVDAVTTQVLDRLRTANASYHAVIVDLLHTDGEGSADLTQRLGRPASRVKDLRHRARRRFALLFFEELRLSVRDEEAHEALYTRLQPYLP